MKGKVVATAAASNGGGGNQTDLLVCFPSRAHLALMPKAICSPSRPPELPKRHHHHHRQPQPRQATSPTATKRTTPASSRSRSCSRSSPLFKTKSRDDTHAPELDEPTSPKVTCAGQIKVRPTRPRSSNASSRPSTETENKNWISVMEEIERIRKDGKKKPASSWWEAVGIKKDALQIFSSFHGLRFNMGCFGSFPGSVDCTSDDEEEDEGSVAREEEVSSSQDVFSKWFMLIEQNNDDEIDLKEDDERVYAEEKEGREEKDDMQNSAVPPPNALLLMRCRSAPANGFLNRAENLETEEERSATRVKEDEQEQEEEGKEKLLVMSYAPDFFKVSMDIAKETWVVGGELDLLAKSRSWKR